MLEAWGNAKTLRNDNSSRFGKFIEIWFDKKTEIIGASNTTYLLEKSRVIFQEKNERNYHVFYQLLFGAPPEILGQLHLLEFSSSPETVNCINQSGCIRMDTINDAKDYNEVADAFRQLGFDPSEPVILSQVVAGVLHLCNTSFVDDGKGTDSCVVAPASEGSCHHVTELWGLDPEPFRLSLLFKKIKSGGKKSNSFVLSPYQVEAAVDNRNSLAKEIYNRCFDWIVAAINKKIAGRMDLLAGTIGVLDIFGFEIFKKVSTSLTTSRCCPAPSNLIPS